MSWWQRGVIYHVYPRSFADADGDGVGDLRGIAERLDHLVWLGVDAVWLSPIYRSPMKDFGYDISDHTAIDPRFGTLEDFDLLVAAAHDRGLRVLLDFVPNHTSDEHPWFDALAASSYIWRDPAPDGGPPNNWLSVFGGPPGRSTPSAASTTRTPTCASSPTSTGATRTCARRCSTCCGSGSTAASTASASTRCARCTRTPSSATTRRTPSSATACRSTTRCCPSAAPTTTTSRPRRQWRR